MVEKQRCRCAGESFGRRVRERVSHRTESKSTGEKEVVYRQEVAGGRLARPRSQKALGGGREGGREEAAVCTPGVNSCPSLPPAPRTVACLCSNAPRLGGEKSPCSVVGQRHMVR